MTYPTLTTGIYTLTASGDLQTATLLAPALDPETAAADGVPAHPGVTVTVHDTHHELHVDVRDRPSDAAAPSLAELVAPPVATRLMDAIPAACCPTETPDADPTIQTVAAPVPETAGDPALSDGVARPSGGGLGTPPLQWYTLRIYPQAGEAGCRVYLQNVTRQFQLAQQATRQTARLEAVAGAISHDFGNPLAICDGFLDMARETEDLSHLDRVERAHERLAAISDKLVTAIRAGQPLQQPVAAPASGNETGADADVDVPSSATDDDAAASLAGLDETAAVRAGGVSLQDVRIDTPTCTDVDLLAVAADVWTEYDPETWAVGDDGAAISFTTTGEYVVPAIRERVEHLFREVFDNVKYHATPDGALTIHAGVRADGAGIYVSDTGGGFAATAGVLDDGADTTTDAATAADGDLSAVLQRRVTDRLPAGAVPADPSVFEYGVTTHDDRPGIGLPVVAEIAASHEWCVTAAAMPCEKQDGDWVCVNRDASVTALTAPHAGARIDVLTTPPDADS